VGESRWGSGDRAVSISMLFSIVVLKGGRRSMQVNLTGGADGGRGLVRVAQISRSVNGG
jgi:hypothetical protein